MSPTVPLNKNTSLPKWASRKSFIANGQQQSQTYMIMKFHEGEGPDFMESVRIADNEPNARMLTIEDAKAILNDRALYEKFVNALDVGDWSYIQTPIANANGGRGAESFRLSQTDLHIDRPAQGSAASVLVLRLDDDAPQAQPPQESIQNFPMPKTDPKRWRALKRDLGILTDRDYLLRAEVLYDKISHDVPADQRVHAMLIVLAAALGRKDDAERLYSALPERAKEGSFILTPKSAEVCICNLVMGHFSELQVQGVLNGWKLSTKAGAPPLTAENALFAYLARDEGKAFEWFIPTIKLYHGDNPGHALEGLMQHLLNMLQGTKGASEFELQVLMRKDPEPKGKGPEKELEYIYTCLWLAVAGGVDLKELVPKSSGITSMSFAVRKGD